MGQTTSIIEYPFEKIDELIVHSKLFQQEGWVNSIDQSKKTITYRLSSDKTSYATISENEWPVKKDKGQFVQGHHYYHIISSGKTYHYDADRDEWVGEQPPETSNDFIEKFQQLLKSAEENSISVDETTELGSTHEMVGGDKSLYELQLTEDVEYPIMGLLRNLKTGSRGVMLISENTFNCKTTDYNDQMTASIKLTSDIDQVKNYILDRWSQATQVNKRSIILINHDEGQLRMISKGSEENFVIFISNIKNMNDMKEYLKYNNISYRG